MLNAQDAYKLLLNIHISPALRALGFTGSSGKYQLPKDKAFVQIGFQKNKWNSQEEIEFTINVSVIPKTSWDNGLKKYPWLGKKPSANGMYPIEMWWERLGHMEPIGATVQWWKLKADTDLEALAGDIMDKVSKNALPLIHNQINKL